MEKEKLVKKGKYMSMLLRHTPEKENLKVDEYGFVDVSKLCKVLGIKRTELEWIVENNDKKRFIFGGGYQKTLIRATQGHSFDIKMSVEPIEPPEILLHGTTWDNKEAILYGGLKKMTRQHVHLTDDFETAENTGMRYAKSKGKLWIISVEAKRMWEFGYDFYKTENDVWLTYHVPSIYIKTK